MKICLRLLHTGPKSLTTGLQYVVANVQGGPQWFSSPGTQALTQTPCTWNIPDCPIQQDSAKMTKAWPLRTGHWEHCGFHLALSWITHSDLPDPPPPVKPSGDCNPDQYLDCNLLKDSEPEPPS